MLRCEVERTPSLAATSVCLLLAATGCGADVVLERDVAAGASAGASSGSNGADTSASSTHGASPPHADGCAVLADAECNGASWEWVYSILADHGGCTSAACHGQQATAALGVYLPEIDPQQFFYTLYTFVDAAGRPYVNRDDPKSSWMPCHVDVHAPGLGESDLSDIDDWLACGALGPG